MAIPIPPAISSKRARTFELFREVCMVTIFRGYRLRFHNATSTVVPTPSPSPSGFSLACEINLRFVPTLMSMATKPPRYLGASENRPRSCYASSASKDSGT